MVVFHNISHTETVELQSKNSIVRAQKTYIQEAKKELRVDRLPQTIEKGNSLIFTLT